VRPLSATHTPQQLTHCQSKAPTQTQKLKTLQKLITSFFHNVIHIMSQLSDPELLKMAVTESTKILPYVLSSRKTIKLYLKVTFTFFFPFTRRLYLPQACLDMWSSADDSVRIATIRAIHRLASAPNESILDLVLKVRTRIQTQGRLIPTSSKEHLPNTT
jgi:nucleolar complex protein 2